MHHKHTYNTWHGIPISMFLMFSECTRAGCKVFRSRPRLQVFKEALARKMIVDYKKDRASDEFLKSFHTFDIPPHLSKVTPYTLRQALKDSWAWVKGIISSVRP